MLVKLTSGLQTKNYLGISKEDLDRLIVDPHYNYLAVRGEAVEVEKKGQIIEFPLVPLTVHKDYLALVQPNPLLSEMGIVWGNSLYGEECFPVIYLKAHKPQVIDLEWIAEIRLVR